MALNNNNKENENRMTERLFFNTIREIKDSEASGAQKARALDFLAAAANEDCDNTLELLSTITRVIDKKNYLMPKSTVKHRLVRVLLSGASVEETRARFLDDLAMMEGDIEDVLRSRGWVRDLSGEMDALAFYDACCLVLIGMKPDELGKGDN